FYAASPTVRYPLSLHDALPIFPGEDLHERRLPGSVRAGQTVALPLVEGDVDVLEQHLAAEVHGDVIDRDHLDSSLCPDAARRAGDRKSTRLNSSHVKSSYAVSC